MDQKEVSTSNAEWERENDCAVPEEAEPEVFNANESDSSSNSSIEDAESLERRLQELEIENAKVFRNLFLQIQSINDNLNNTIREISMGIAEQNA